VLIVVAWAIFWLGVIGIVKTVADLRVKMAEQGYEMVTVPGSNCLVWQKIK
jgi:hypothetical protein